MTSLEISPNTGMRVSCHVRGHYTGRLQNWVQRHNGGRLLGRSSIPGPIEELRIETKDGMRREAGTCNAVQPCAGGIAIFGIEGAVFGLIGFQVNRRSAVLVNMKASVAMSAVRQTPAHNGGDHI